MKTPSESLLEVSTRLVYSIDRITPDLRIFWNEFLRFYFAGKLIDTQIRQRHITAASSRFRSPDEVKDHVDSLDTGVREDLIVLLIVLKQRAIKLDDWMAAKNIGVVIDTLATPGPPTDHLEDQAIDLEKRFVAFENPQVFTIKGAIFVVTLDYLFRWLLIVVGNSLSFSPDLLFELNFIPTVIFAVVGYVISRSHRRYNGEMVARHVAGPFRLQTRYATWQYTAIAFYFISGVFMTVLLKGGPAAPGIEIWALLGLLVYYYFLLVLFPAGRLSEDDVLAGLHRAQAEESLDSDQNDEAIVTLETKLIAQTGRLEAYVLESALFGALAFSGFLQIIATNLISFAHLEQFADSALQVSRAFVTANWELYHQHAAALSTKESLFCIVSIETLLCSALFLAVIAARLRFSDVADNVRGSLNLAKVYNDKEELLLESSAGPQRNERLVMLNEKVNTHITAARSKLGRIGPIVVYMAYFRNAGIVIFFMVLVSSTLFISEYLGWAFTLFALATLLYFNLKSVIAGVMQFTLSFQVFFEKYSWRLFIAALIPAVAGFLLRTAGVFATDGLSALSLLLVTVFFYTWIVFMPHYDKRFGDIEYLKGETWRSNRYRLVKNIFGIGILFTGVGFALKFVRLAGADEFIVLGLTVLAISSYAVGYYLSRPRWLGIVCGLVSGNSAFALLFKLLHLPGANEMMMVALAFQALFYMMFIFKREGLHRIVFRVVIAFSIAMLVMVEFGGAGIYTRLTLMYSHQTLHAAPLVDTFLAIPSISEEGDPSAEELAKQIDSCDRYLASYPLVTMTIVHRRWGYYFYEVVLDNLYDGQGNYSRNAASLEMASRAFGQMMKIQRRYGYVFGNNILLEADVLLALGKTDEAIVALRQLSATATGGARMMVDAKLRSVAEKQEVANE